MAQGSIFLIGAGPGDPALITVKGVEAIKAADCVIYDFLASSRLLDYADPKAERIYVGKKGATNIITQKEITALMIERARRGKTVARLKGGDPFIFGRGAEEAEEIIDAGLNFEVIPGVTSAIAAPAFAGIPLTHREFSSAVTFITGQEDPIKERTNIAWDRLSTGRGTLVFLMGWKNLPLIRKKLLANGWDPATPVALVRWGTMTRQVSVTGTLEDAVKLSKKAGMLPPMVIVVGEVVNLKQKLDWFESRPLFGKRVLVTRTAEQAGAFSSMLENRGAEPINFPTIKTVYPPSFKECDRAIKRITTYDWAIFTSANGVKYFIERINKLGLDIRELKGVRLCAVGSQTAAVIKGLGIKVDLVPEKFVAEGLLQAFGRRGIKGKRFLLPRALKAREILPIEINRLGGSIDVVPVYKTVRPRKGAAAIRERFIAGEIDAVTFTSSSTVTNFAAMFKKGEAKKLIKNSLVAVIGPVTAATAKELGFTVDVMPEEYTIPGLCSALETYYRRTPKKLKK